MGNPSPLTLGLSPWHESDLALHGLIALIASANRRQVADSGRDPLAADSHPLVLFC